jgi:hypothetical protein
MRRIMKKNFSCGHRGLGQYCHRCVAEKALELKASQHKREKEQKEQERVRRKLDLMNIEQELNVKHGTFPVHVLKKAHKIVESIRKGESIQNFKAKKLKTIGQRSIIRIKVNDGHRIIFIQNASDIRFLELLTHEKYNSRIASGGWL